DEASCREVVVVDGQGPPEVTGEEVGRVDRAGRAAVDRVEHLAVPEVLQGAQHRARHDATHAAALHGQADLVAIRAPSGPTAGGAARPQHGQYGMVRCPRNLSAGYFRHAVL